MTSTSPVLAVQYVRMSTDRQDLSPEIQMEAIARYALDNGFAVVETYLDAGVSGRSLDGRAEMKRLLLDVTRADRRFYAVLVYDVSRWGRFQDPDASAYYEYHCRLLAEGRADQIVHASLQVFQPLSGYFPDLEVLHARIATCANSHLRSHRVECLAVEPIGNVVFLAQRFPLFKWRHRSLRLNAAFCSTRRPKEKRRGAQANGAPWRTLASFRFRPIGRWLPSGRGQNGRNRS